MDRRGFLARGSVALGLGLVASGCTDDPAPAPTPIPTQPLADPDASVRAAVAADEAEVIAAYRAALAAAPALAPELEPLLAHHEAHLARVARDATTPSPPPPELGATRDPFASASPAPSEVSPVPDASPTPDASGSAPDASPDPEPTPSPDAGAQAAALLRRLAELEVAATTQRTRACNGASDPDLARELCLISASEAQHAEVLQDAARRARRGSA